MIFYIHGFNSSAKSSKAQQLLRWMGTQGLEDQIIIPSLSSVPAVAIAELERLVALQTDHQLAFIGSSLGGYYATWLAQRYQSPAVLINPAVKPYQLLVDYLGPNVNYYSGEEYQLNAEHIEQLKALEVGTLDHPEQFLVLLQTADEVLDYTQASEKYAASQLIIETGGDHSFSGFERHFDRILHFCGIKPAPKF
ncbi:MAG: esterase YqiA [Gammaproteobacteria bacterium]|nr:esterase YqiA [Gammaproteobacteria bacterium]